MEEDANAAQLVKYMSDYCKMGYCPECTGAGTKEQVLVI